MKKSQERWGDAHVKLRELFEKRAGMSQLEFAERFGLGTQGMVWQYLSGYRPLNYEAAAKFAKGLNCRIDDFSPEMAEALRNEILPVLGRGAKVAAKAALFLAFLLPPLLPHKADAATHSVLRSGMVSRCVFCKLALRVWFLAWELAKGHAGGFFRTPGKAFC